MKNCHQTFTGFLFWLQSVIQIRYLPILAALFIACLHNSTPENHQNYRFCSFLGSPQTVRNCSTIRSSNFFFLGWQNPDRFWFTSFKKETVSLERKEFVIGRTSSLDWIIKNSWLISFLNRRKKIASVQILMQFVVCAPHTICSSPFTLRRGGHCAAWATT